MTKLTPLMQQYWEIKNAHPDKILFFRMGDFFELFHDDAVLAAPILDIVLTSRNKKAEDETPMCGMPHHSVASPINRLLARGFKIAICDQLEDPKQAKGLVKRGITRILSPGMVYNPEELDGQKPNYLCAFDAETLSFLEPTTGECFYFRISNLQNILDLMAILNPVELVLTDEQKTVFLETKKEAKGPHLTVHLNRANFQVPESAQRLISYAVYMQGEDILKTLGEFSERPLNSRLKLTPTVLKHLEIFENYNGEVEGSLFHAVDRTKTSAGGRVLKQWLMLPLLSENDIYQRQNKIQSWTLKSRELGEVRSILGRMGDIERRLGKLSNPNCNPRDILAIAESLDIGLQITRYLETPESLIPRLKTTQALVHTICSTLVDEPPLSKREAGLIRKGYHADLDELIDLTTDAQATLLELEMREKTATGITTLKIRYNNVFGYYIEVTNSHKNKIPAHYQRKQTLVNAERYITDELLELEKKVLSARTKREQMELEIFEDLRRAVLAEAHHLLILSRFWAESDVLCGFAQLAIERKYSAPKFNHTGIIDIKSSRHPVIEQIIRSQFVPNDLILKKGETLLLTGPNMAGKSTLMRQVALTCILAQTGSFVPATYAELPLFENIFTRIGASDALTQGLSTFMVEMIETAEILNGAGERSLIVMDEIGRGTSTYDGMSLAQAILEHVSRLGKFHVLFATHYHELTELEKENPKIRNAHMSIREKAGDLYFLYTLNSGPANRSYGIEVAKRAGLPLDVVNRAKMILKEREKERTQATTQMSLFGLPEKTAPESGEDIKKLFKDVSIETLTPVQALLKLQELKDKVLN